MTHQSNTKKNIGFKEINFVYESWEGIKTWNSYKRVLYSVICANNYSVEGGEQVNNLNWDRWEFVMIIG